MATHRTPADPTPPDDAAEEEPPARGRARWLPAVLASLAGATLVLGLTSGAGPAQATVDRPAAQGDAADGPDAELLARGASLYGLGCVSCHGADGQGQRAPDGDLRGPSLENAGAAGAFYQLRTGRMPLSNPREVPSRKTPAYDDDEIEALVAYVASLGDGPPMPEVDPDAGDLAEGGVLYRESCQACHSSTGSGGALSYGRAAPPLAAASPEEIAAAIRSGPGQMPRFGPELVDQHQLDSITRYVTYLEDPDDRGGLALGRLGPIPEGFMVWVGALGLLLVTAYWMGSKRATMPHAPATTDAPAAGDPPADAPVGEPDDAATTPPEEGRDP